MNKRKVYVSGRLVFIPTDKMKPKILSQGNELMIEMNADVYHLGDTHSNHIIGAGIEMDTDVTIPATAITIMAKI